MKKLSNKHRIAIAASIEAGKAIMEIFHSDELGTTLKEDKSPVTKADLLSTDIILNHLKQFDIPTIGEEEEEKDFELRKEYGEVWIIDPLDGTKEFIKKTKEFTVNIGLVKDQQPIFGVIYVPFTKEVFFGGKEFGSFKFDFKEEELIHNQIENAVLLPLIEQKVVDLRVTGGRKTDLEFLLNFELTKNLDFSNYEFIRLSSSLKFCRIAEGEMDIYPRDYPCMEWDTAAGHAIMHGVGKEVYDVNTAEVLKYNKADLYNPFFILL